MSTISKLMMLGASGSATDSFWVRTFAGGKVYGGDAAIDAAGNVAFVALVDKPSLGLLDQFIVKCDPSGAILWEKQAGSTLNDGNSGVSFDADGNVITGGKRNTTFASMSKYDPDGNLLWGTSQGTSADYHDVYRVYTDSTYLYFSGYAERTGTNIKNNLFMKYTLSGSKVFSKTIDYPSGHQYGYGIHTDSSGNIYIVGGTYLTKLTSTGSLTWQKELTPTTNLYGVCVDSNDRVIVIGYSSSTAHTYLMQFDSSGTKLWSKKMPSIEGSCVAVDSNDNIFIGGISYISPTGTYDCLVAMYDSSGVLQWGRSLGQSNGWGAKSIQVQKKSIVLGGISNTTTTSKNGFVTKLASNGSGVGTYGTLVYKEITLTEVTDDTTAYTGSYAAATASLSATSSGLTFSDVSHSTVLYELA